MVESMMVIEKPGVRGPSAAVEIARQAFLFGNGDGNPVTSTARLSEVSGVHEKTLQRYIPGWIKEREDMLLSAGNGSFGLSLSPETLENHRKNTKFLEEQTAELRREVATIKTLEKVLLDAVKSAQVHDPESATQVLALVQSFIGSSAARKSLQTQFVALQRAWKENAGIDALQDVATAREKTLATGRARLDIKREEAGGTGPQPTGGREVPTVDSVFDVGEDDGMECG